MEEDMKKLCKVFVTVVVAAAILLSCQNKGKEVNKVDGDGVDTVQDAGRSFDNPIDSIIHSVHIWDCYEEVCRYLLNHPDFVKRSDTVGYYQLDDDFEPDLLWKDEGDVRVYSIPSELHYALLSRNIIQDKKTGALDTLSLQDEMGCMKDFNKIKSTEGKTYYVLRTSVFVVHQGANLRETLSAFSIENGTLVNEKIFRTKNANYDQIEVDCGGQRYCPLSFDQIDLVGLFNFEESDDVPTVVITNINENYWPTGDGLKYQWDGHCFQYVGKCKYDANGYYYE